MNVYNIPTIYLIFTFIIITNQLSFKLNTSPICLKFKGGDSYNF